LFLVSYNISELFLGNQDSENAITNVLVGAADDLELVGWLCERIWVLQGNFTNEDGYAAARVSIAEMLKTGTTCFLESMVRSTCASFPIAFLTLGLFLIRIK
jgi:cytosine/adenosine deaminase-related metal-dependent hydrolase